MFAFFFIKKLRNLFSFGIVLLLSACATQQQVQLKKDFWQNKEQTLGILVVQVAQDRNVIQQGGRIGLLDHAINNAMASDLNAYLEKQEIVELNVLGKRIAERARAIGVKAVMIDKKITMADLKERPGQVNDGFARHDFSPIIADYKLDRLLVLSPVFTGTARNYYGFIPTSDPVGTFQAFGELIEVPSHTLVWYKPINATRQVKQPWDQPPNFPNVTQAMRDAINTGIRLLENDLFWSAR